MKKFLGFIFAFFLVFLLVACDDGVYKVTFDSNGGSPVEAVEVNKGESLSQPDDPTKDGHIFGGWYKDKDLSTTWSFEKYVVADLTFMQNGYQIKM